jgi:hypothetical protein
MDLSWLSQSLGFRFCPLVIESVPGKIPGTPRNNWQQQMAILRQRKEDKTLILRHQSQLPAIDRSGFLPTYKQEVAGSSPALPTILWRPSFRPVCGPAIWISDFVYLSSINTSPEEGS